MNEIKPGCFLIIYNNNNELLLQIRWDYSKYWETHSFFWWMMEEWESPIQTISREILEELNFFISNYKYLWSVKNTQTDIGTFQERHIYLTKINMSADKFTVLEWDGCEFQNIWDLRKQDFYNILGLEPIVDLIEKELSN
jgi:hypothetical protein